MKKIREARPLKEREGRGRGITIRIRGGEIKTRLILSTEHAASSYGRPVLVDMDGVAYGPGDVEEVLRSDEADKKGLIRGGFVEKGMI